jgi:hypothetical protein
MQTSYCKPTVTTGEQITICSKSGKDCNEVAISAEDVARLIASYAITCWENQRSTATQTIPCYSIFLETHPGNVSEVLMTQIMERENACKALENSKVVDEKGNFTDYAGNCGTTDGITWDVSGYVISTQSLVSIMYDRAKNNIVISA